MWDGWVDVDHPRIYIIGHWNYEPAVTKDMYVVSSADKVELLLNGRSLGYGLQSNRFLYTFKNVHWQPGTIRAVGYDKKGNVLCSAQKMTAGKPYAIRLTAHNRPGVWQADGHDLVLVDVEVTDANGNRCPVSFDMIHFALSGPAEWRGGMAQGPDNYILSNNLPVECGINRVLIRSTREAGKITLTAEGQGLQGASLTLSTASFVADN